LALSTSDPGVSAGDSLGKEVDLTGEAEYVVEKILRERVSESQSNTTSLPLLDPKNQVSRRHLCQVSRKHATLSYLPESNTFTVTDHGSLNGVFANRLKIQPRSLTPIAVGSELVIGGHKPELPVGSRLRKLEPWVFAFVIEEKPHVPAPSGDDDQGGASLIKEGLASADQGGAILGAAVGGSIECREKGLPLADVSVRRTSAAVTPPQAPKRKHGAETTEEEPKLEAQPPSAKKGRTCAAATTTTSPAAVGASARQLRAWRRFHLVCGPF
jgi:hypothetical protein